MWLLFLGYGKQNSSGHKCLESSVMNFPIIVQFLKNGFKSLPVRSVPGDQQPTRS